MSSAAAKGHKDRKLMHVLAGDVPTTPPIWLMRQAGRYLPEYRATRAEAGGFLKLCYTPALAAEVTLQPIRRYGFDAAILFSDILVVPDALGQSVAFMEGEGPKLEPIQSSSELKRLDRGRTGEKFGLICETVSRLRQDLPLETTLIGFCGAPWTVATYVVGGEGSSDQAAARRFAYQDPKGFQQLMDILVDTSVDYLGQQIDAGADTESLPIFILGGAREWVKEKTGSDLDDWLRVPANARAVADALDTVLIGNKRDREELEEALALMPEGLERTAYIAGWKDRRRSSLNNIGAAAANLVLGLRALADEQEAGAAA